MLPDVLIPALLVWLVPALVSAGVVKRQADEMEDNLQPCRSYVMNSLIHLDCSNRGLKDLPDHLDYDFTVSIGRMEDSFV